MPTLRARKVIYTVLIIGAGAVWLPYLVLGFVVGIGALGLLCVLSLLRCIWVLPVESRFSRGFYSVAITLGIIMMSGCLVFLAVWVEPLTLGPWALLVSGALLLTIGSIVVLEVHARHA